MTQKEIDELPQLELYRVDAAQISKFASLFTAEAAAEVAASAAAAVIAVEDNVACGAICMKLVEGQEELLDLLSLYVVPQYRCRGVAGTLFLETMEEIFDATDGLVHYCRCVGTNAAEGLPEFLEKAGFSVEEEQQSGSFVLPLGELRRAPLLSYAVKLPQGCELVPVGDLSALAVRKVFQTLAEASVDYMAEAELLSACQEISYVVLNEKEELSACAIFTEHENRLCLSQFYVRPGTSVEGIRLLQTSVQRALEQYGDEKEAEIPILSASSLRLMEKLLGVSCRRIPMRTAYYEM